MPGMWERWTLTSFQNGIWLWNSPTYPHLSTKTSSFLRGSFSLFPFPEATINSCNGSGLLDSPLLKTVRGGWQDGSVGNALHLPPTLVTRVCPPGLRRWKKRTNCYGLSTGLHTGTTAQCHYTQTQTKPCICAFIHTYFFKQQEGRRCFHLSSRE